MALRTQSQTTSTATDELRQIEIVLFTIDKKMSEYVDNLQNAEDAFALQVELDNERYINNHFIITYMAIVTITCGTNS